MTQPPYCVHPTKRRYLNGKEAADALATIQRRKQLAPGEYLPTRIYECVGGHWHLTSKPQREVGEHTPEDNVPREFLPDNARRTQDALEVFRIVESVIREGGKVILQHGTGVKEALRLPKD